MSSLKKDLENAFKKTAGIPENEPNPNIEELAENLADSIANFTLKQTVRIDKFEVPLNVEKIETNGPIKGNVAPDTLFGPYAPVVKTLKDISSLVPGLGSVVSKVEGLILKACQKVSEGGSETPALDLRKDGGSGLNPQPSLNVEGTAVFEETTTPNQQKPKGISKNTAGRIYKGELVDVGTKKFS